MRALNGYAGNRWQVLLRAVIFCLVVCAPLISWGTVSVASFNLQNYLLTDRPVGDEYLTAYPKPEIEKAALRAVIAHARPDVLAIQEMGDRSFLKEFQRDLAAYSLDYPHVAWCQGEDEERHTAVLSQYPFSSVICHDTIEFGYAGQRKRLKRGLLEVQFGKGERKWSVFVVHLKSRWTSDERDPESAKWRTAEAQAIRDFLLERYKDDWKDARFLVVGDFNDTRDTATLRRFLTKGKRSLLQIIPTTDSRGENWTYHYAKADTYERVDYLLASPRMFQQLRKGSGKIVDLLPESAIASDHRLIWAEFDFK